MIVYRRPHAGSTADIAIFCQNINWNEKNFRKINYGELQVQDDGEYCEQFTGNWKILCNKGYIGLQTEVRAICPKKKPIDGKPALADRARNQKILHDRVLEEMFFARVCTFGLFAQKWRWSEESHKHFLRTVIALIIRHVSLNPLCSGDSTFSRTVMKHLYSIGAFIGSKCPASQIRYLQAKKRRVTNMVSSVLSSDTSEEDSVYNLVG